jgi:nitrate reductase NapAB chaperone NapD
MKCGAYVMGYDMSQINAEEIDTIKNIPEIILVKRIYPEQNKDKRIFKLRRMEKDGVIVEEKEKQKK